MAMICTTSRRIPASASRNQGSENRRFDLPGAPSHDMQRGRGVGPRVKHRRLPHPAQQAGHPRSADAADGSRPVTGSHGRSSLSSRAVIAAAVSAHASNTVAFRILSNRLFAGP